MGICKREVIISLINMPEAGALKLGMAGRFSVYGRFALETQDDAFTTAEKGVGLG